MNEIKVTFLFFVVFSLFLLASCTLKEEIKSSENRELDSIGLFIKDMKNSDLDYKTRLNKANRAYQKSIRNKSDKRIEEILNYKIYLLGSIKHYDSAVYTLKKLLKKSIGKKDSAYIGRVYSSIAYYFNRNQQKDSAYYYYNLIKNEYLKYNDSITNGNNLLVMAIIEKSYGDYISSEYSSSLALGYYNDKKPDLSASAYNNWAISSRNQGQQKDALIFYKKAIDLTSSKENKLVYKNNIANVYRVIGDYKNSIKILDSLNKEIIIKPVMKAKVIDNLAYTKWLANKQESILPELEKALKIRLQENDLEGLIASYAHLSKYFENLNPKKALSYASTMYDVAISQNSTQDQLEALQKLIKLENSSKVREHYNRYVYLNDSLQLAEQKAKNKFAKIKYDSEKNREDNLQLKITTSKKELELEKEKNKNVIGAVSSGTVLLGFIAFGFYRKQKHNQEKRAEVYKTETRIAKKIHDEVANNVVNIMNKVQYTEESKEVLLGDLEKVYLLTRDISHQNNTVETGSKFENSLKSLLTSFNTNETTIILKDINNVELENILKDKQIEIYRVLQELMVNMQKHSEATLVAISFKKNKKQYSINYSDNGVGLEIENLNLKNGLKNVETRIQSINGTVTFDSKLNNGFKVFISLKKL